MFSYRFSFADNCIGASVGFVNRMSFIQEHQGEGKNGYSKTELYDRRDAFVAPACVRI